MKIKLSILMSLLLTVSLVITAQGYDDIYYNSSNSKKKETKKTNAKKTEASQVDNNSIDYNDTFIGFNNNRDVDEYNRRNITRDTLGVDSTTMDEYEDFAYTDRIRRFHNPSVIVEANDPEITELYYNTTPTVNLIIGTPSYWNPYWDWNWGYYDWTWGWSPYNRWRVFHSAWYSPWYYDWGWSFGWTWHHHHHHHNWWGPGHHHGGPNFSGPVHGNGNNKVPGRVNRGRRVFGQGTVGNSSGIGRRPAIETVRSNKGANVNNNRRPDVNRTSKSSSSNRRSSVSRSYNNNNRSSSYNSDSYSGGSRSGGSYSGGGSRGGGGGSRGGRR